MNKDRLLVISFLLLSAVSIILGFSTIGSRIKNDSTKTAKAMLIKVEGEIHSGRSNYQTAGADTILAKIKEARESSDVKGVLIEINSPGGTVGASQEIYTELMKLKKEKKIVVSMKDIAASGGYYIACAADYIFAESGTITGSIGVIAMTPIIGKFLEKHSIGVRVYKAGKYKDLLSMFREPSEEEETIINNLLKDTYNQFLSDVADGRSLELSYVQQIAEGKIYSGKRALKAKLIDAIGGRREALDKLTELTGSKVPLDVTEEEEFPFEKFLQMFRMDMKNSSDFKKYLQLEKTASPVLIIVPSYIERFLQ